MNNIQQVVFPGGISSQVLQLISSLFLGVSLAIFCRHLSQVEPLGGGLGGERGKQRRRALRQSSFQFVDPLIRALGAIVQAFVINCQKKSGWLDRNFEKLLVFQERQLRLAGLPLGLEPFEILALSLFSSLGGACLGLWAGATSSTYQWVVPGALIFFCLPNVRLQSIATARFSEMSRELPVAIDLTALAMNSGSDFPGALRRVIEGQVGVVSDEISQVLTSLDLGMTRRSALVSMRERIPIQEVRDLVRAILLAEKKGSSVTAALAQQARSSRQRRSVRAEEAAARAGVLLLLPLMLLMGCIMILLVGPLLCSGMSI